MKFSTKIITATATLFFLTASVIAQKGYFTTMSSGNLRPIEPKVKLLKKLIYLQLDEQSLRSYLLKAPMEFKNQGRTLPLEIPLPNGKFENFNMVESPILSDKQAALHPEIKTYTGKGTSDKNTTLRLSLTSSGFNAIILIGNGDAVYFEKFKGAQDIYFSYFAKDVTDIKINGKKLPGGSGGSDFIDLNKHKFTNGLRPAGTDAVLSTGSTLTLFRIVMSADGEFVALHGGTQASAYNDAVGYVNRLNIVYRNELSVGFTLVSGQDLMFLDAATDPYDNDDEGQIITTNTHTIDSAIGSANYDLATVLGYYPNTTGGGLAYIGSLGNNDIKGGATTAEGGTDVVAQALNDKTFFHETGHQFGMTHSFNSTIPVCVSREPGTSVEPGAGITIMSYSQICDGGAYIGDDYFVPEYPESRALLQFHTVNYQQAVAYLQTIQPYPSGVVVTNTGNNAPVITMPATYTIPKSTPFALTGIATDETPAALTYCWEGTNTGGDDAHPPDANTLADPAQSPFSRTYAPAGTGTRTFPIIDSILNGSNKARADKLPSVSVPLTYNLTVRDNNPGAGAVSFGSVTVTVNGNIGPFLETKNLSGTYAGLSTQTITWSVNGTNAATPNIKISLSTDGGFTFPVVLLASTPNDGSQSVTLPNITTTTARIKVEGVGNIFFDISNANFSINAAATTYTITASAGPNGAIAPGGTVSVAKGTSKTFTITPNAGFTVASVSVDGSSVGAVPTYTFSNVIANHTISATFSPTTSGQQVVSFTLVNAITNKDIQTLVNGATLNLQCLPTKYLNIRANTSPSVVGRVEFMLTGAQKHNQTEEYIPYALFGNHENSADYNSWVPPVGNYTLRATPFTSKTGGTAGTSLTITFKVTSEKDIKAPVITCKPNATKHISKSAEPEVYKVSGTEFNATATDNCTLSSLIYSLSGATVAAYNSANKSLAGKQLKEGTTTITWKATDAANNISTCKTIVIVTDDDEDDNNLSAPVSPVITFNAETWLKAKVSPNPAVGNFTLRLSGNSSEPVQVKAVDIYGRSMYQTKGSANETYRFGQHFIAGTYIVQVLQGKNVKTIKVIKN